MSSKSTTYLPERFANEDDFLGWLNANPTKGRSSRSMNYVPSLNGFRAIAYLSGNNTFYSVELDKLRDLLIDNGQSFSSHGDPVIGDTYEQLIQRFGRHAYIMALTCPDTWFPVEELEPRTQA